MNKEKVTCAVCGSYDVYVKGLCSRCYHKQYYINNGDKKRESSRRWRQKHPVEFKLLDERQRRRKGVLPMSKNRNCSFFLGVHVAERVLSKIFDNVIRQPINNPGFDFICNKGYKIDVKSGCLCYGKKNKPYWHFHIDNNKIADFFLCIAFDNRKDLNPIHIWLFPASDVNSNVSIQSSITTISKWDKYVIDIDKVSKCCDIMKGEHK